MKRFNQINVGVLCALSIFSVLLMLFMSSAIAKSSEYTLTILHSGDYNSTVLGVESSQDMELYGTASRFVDLSGRLKSQALQDGNTDSSGLLILSQGEFIGAKNEFFASFSNGFNPFYDSIVVNAVGYDAIGLGLRDFFFGPSVVAELISNVPDVPILSVNMDVSLDPSLLPLAHRIVPSVVVEKGGELIGIVGVTTPDINVSSSPGNVIIYNDIVARAQAEIDNLTAQGINKIVLLTSQLDVLQSEPGSLSIKDFAEQLRDVDIVVGGRETSGDNTLLADARKDRLMPEHIVEGDYPLPVTNAGGDKTLIVMALGDFQYIGRLIVNFDANGHITQVNKSNSQPVIVASSGAPNNQPDPTIVATVEEPVQSFIDNLSTTIIATSDVDLDGSFGSGPPNEVLNAGNGETNVGNLVMDSTIFAAEKSAIAGDLVAVQNASGIRLFTVLPAGDISIADIYAIQPFLNNLAAMTMPREQLRDVLEAALSSMPTPSGGFPQISGISMTYDQTGTAHQWSLTTGATITQGTRVVDVTLANGTPIVVGGVVQAGPPVTLITSDFLASNNRYPMRGLPFITFGLDRTALQDYIVSPTATGGLDGEIKGTQYPVHGDGRIVRLP